MPLRGMFFSKPINEVQTTNDSYALQTQPDDETTEIPRVAKIDTYYFTRLIEYLQRNSDIFKVQKKSDFEYYIRYIHSDVDIVVKAKNDLIVISQYKAEGGPYISQECDTEQAIKYLQMLLPNAFLQTCNTLFENYFCTFEGPLQGYRNSEISILGPKKHENEPYQHAEMFNMHITDNKKLKLIWTPPDAIQMGNGNGELILKLYLYNSNIVLLNIYDLIQREYHHLLQKSDFTKILDEIQLQMPYLLHDTSHSKRKKVTPRQQSFRLPGTSSNNIHDYPGGGFVAATNEDNGLNAIFVDNLSELARRILTLETMALK